MAKRKTKGLQARKSDASRDDDSLLIRSAESLGRVIGSLRRSVQDGTKRMSTIAESAIGALPELPRSAKRRPRRAPRKASPVREPTATRKAPATRKAAAGRPSAARKPAGKKGSRRG